ncbi:MAG: DUF2817 domain-containing protein [Rhodocyclaceae bacterium]|nr:DUF2817 domain-containing protein [Rhodocyclaceae bacterium]
MNGLPELAELDAILAIGGDAVRVREVAQVEARGHRFPIRVITLGTERPDAPAIGYFGGVHGLERIGTAVVLAYLRSLMVRLRWDDTLHALLRHVHMVFMPLVNPAGMWLGTRANPDGIDLMRNSPAEASGSVPWLVGGQRLSAALPWFRGVAGAAMAPESIALCKTVEARLFDRPLALTLDCHSGFGASDRIWVPYARSREPIEHLPEADALRRLFDDTYANHRYVFEPQSLQYLAHGDLWDHLYDRALARQRGSFLPLTLEMGSWLWVRKNPRQAFSRGGIFNPVATHRFQRVLRRHISFLDFLARACASHARWLPQEPARSAARREVVHRWYGSPR